MSELPLFLQEEYWPDPGQAVFLLPRWQAISDIILDTREGEERQAAWALARERWLAHLLGVLNWFTPARANASGSGRLNIVSIGFAGETAPRPYYAARAEPFTIVSTLEPEMAAQLNALGLRFRALALEELGARVAGDPPLGYVVLILHDPVLARAYLRRHNYAGHPGAVLLEKAAPHVVLGPASPAALPQMLVHMLNYSVLQKYPIPAWLHMGISHYFEGVLLPDSKLRPVSRKDLARTTFWQEHGLAGFWDGAYFRDARAAHANTLAFLLTIELLKRDSQGFHRFVRKADRRDGGDAAARLIFGTRILEIARELLGPGDWSGPPPASPAAPPIS